MTTNSTPRIDTYTLVSSPADEKILASKGTLAKQLVLTETLGFMAMSYKLFEITKLGFLPFSRTHLVASWIDERELAFETFDKS